MASGPKCFRCMLEMSSGPAAGEFFVLFIVSAVQVALNCGVNA